MRLALSGVLLALAGCGDEGPSDTLPQVGRYAYTFQGFNTSIEPIQFAGALVLTFVSEDSMAGRWEVPGYNPNLFDGRRFTDHWFLMATAPEEGVASHDVFPGDESLPVTCGMTYNTGSGPGPSRGSAPLSASDLAVLFLDAQGPGTQ